METIQIKYRTWFRGTPPRPIRLEVPGWAGDRGYSDGDKPQPWHCKPFVDGSTYGLELLYPFRHDLVVRTSMDDKISFEGDFSEEEAASGLKMPPFMTFAPHHYGFTSSLDLKTPPGIVTRIEPHPRYYTDRTGTVPLPTAGHIESEWWSRIFFIAFAAPHPGRHHVFRYNEPYAQLLFVPAEVKYDIEPMSVGEAAVRQVREDNIRQHGNILCNRDFQDHNGNNFDNKYKVMSKINAREGIEGVDKYITEVIDKLPKPKKISGFKFKKKKNQGGS